MKYSVSGPIMFWRIFCLFFDCSKGSKLIFSGDPAQLPPVGDRNSRALDESYFLDKGLKVMSAELTDVVRQGHESAVLSNAGMLRELLADKYRNTLQFTIKEGEFERIDERDIVDSFLEMSPAPSMDAPVVICYTNAQTMMYNLSIRKKYFGENSEIPRKGDVMIIVGNNYNNPVRPILNGEFAQVLDASEEIETQSAAVYVKNGGKTEQKTIALQYRDVRLRFMDGQIVAAKILDSLLNGAKRDLDYYEICSVFINFKMRHPKLKPGSVDFKQTLLSDPYVNAIKVKYGYAITGHKSQGGEWKTVFVDFRGRSGLSDDNLRWCYTAITRAGNILYGANIPEMTPLSGMHVFPVRTYKKLPDDALSFKDVPENSFHGKNAPVYLKAKFGNIRIRLSGSHYSIYDVHSISFRERYTILDHSGNKYIVDGVYSSSGLFRDFTTNSSGEEAEHLLSLMNMPDEYYLGYDYIPSCRSLELLYGHICSLCDDNGICIMNVLEKIGNYKVTYFLRKDKDVFYVDFSVDKDMNITSVQVMAAPGMEMSAAEVISSSFE